MLKVWPSFLRRRSSTILPGTQRFLTDDTQKRERESSMLTRLREELERDKKHLKWRKSSAESGNIDVKLKLIANEEQTSDYILFMQKPLELNPKKWLEAWDKKQEKKERFMQQFVKERHDILGPDLATAHFILHRGGAVKFTNSENWMRADEDKEFKLPNRYVPSYQLAAVRCDNMRLYYEGVENIRWLQHLKFLSFHNVLTFDDWCLDRVSGSQCDKLEVLDVAGTQCTVRGLACLYRLRNLKLLIVSDPKESLEYELSCSMLQEVLPQLKIVAGASIHDK